MIDNVITIGWCYLSAMPEDANEKQALLFDLIEGRECKLIEQVENCTMAGIEACEEQTVGSIFHLLFDFFRDELLCNGAPEVRANENSSRKFHPQHFFLPSCYPHRPLTPAAQERETWQCCCCC
jgi:hypothetical protein